MPVMPNLSAMMPMVQGNMPLSLRDKIAMLNIDKQKKALASDKTLEARIRQLIPNPDVESIPIDKPTSNIESIPITPQDPRIEGFDIAPPVSSVESIPIAKPTAPTPHDLGGTNVERILKELANRPQTSLIEEEAKKFGSAEEFVKAKRKEFEIEQGREPSSDEVLDRWFKAKQRQKVMGVGAERAGDLPKLTEMPKGRLENIEFLPDGKVKLYRGTPENIKDKTIRYGDFMSPKKAKAQFYGEVTEHIVDSKDIAYLSEDELVYANDSEKIAEPETFSITDIYNKVNKKLAKRSK